MIKETLTWKLMKHFEESILDSNIKFSEIPISIPEKIEKIAVERWNSKIEKESQKYSETEIKPHTSTSSGQIMNALYIDKKMTHYPGKQISLVGINQEGNNVSIGVSQIYYPYVVVLQDGEFAEINAQQKNQIMPLHLCTFAITTDSKIALTVRGPKLMSYPNTLWGEGGNPETPATDIIEHQQREMLEEILVKPEESSQFRFMGVATIKLPHKNTFLDILPGLLGYTHVNLSSKEIKERVLERPMSQRPDDAIDVVFCPATPEGLSDYLSERTSIFQYCPTGHAGLILYGSEIGINWKSDLFLK